MYSLEQLLLFISLSLASEAVAKGYSTKSSFSLREKVRMRERRKPLNCISHSLTLQSLTPALSRREREFIGFCDTL